MIDTITASELRRHQVTSFNISLVVAGMAALGGITELDPAYVALPALPLAAIWVFSIRYFRRLSKAKWAVVHEMESHFENQPFSDEWQKFKEIPDWLPLGLTHLEMLVPASVFVASASYLALRLHQLIF